MAQDFAKTRNNSGKSGKQKSSRSATRNTPPDQGHWSWFFSGLLTGCLFCVIGYFVVINLNKQPLLPDDTATSETPAAPDDQAGTDLEFYDYLPQAEVEVNVVPVEVASNTGEQEENPVHYILQAGSFPDSKAAEEQRAKIILLNMDAKIVPAEISGRTWYRVWVGPFVGRDSVESAEKALFEHNIDNIRLRPKQQ